MRPAKVTPITDDPHWFDYADFAEYQTPPRTLYDTGRFWKRCLQDLLIIAGMALVATGLIWAGTSGWRHMNAVTGWILKAVGL